VFLWSSFLQSRLDRESHENGSDAHSIQNQVLEIRTIIVSVRVFVRVFVLVVLLEG
jgi:hypothetical protein